MVDKLPYELTAGVTATREGLELTDEMHVYFGDALAPLYRWHSEFMDENILPWPDAAERLRYREGEPWCWADPKAMAGIMCPGIKLLSWDSEYDVALHRLAAILCDDATAFRVLHWAVHNLGGES